MTTLNFFKCPPPPRRKLPERNIEDNGEETALLGESLDSYAEHYSKIVHHNLIEYIRLLKKIQIQIGCSKLAIGYYRSFVFCFSINTQFCVQNLIMFERSFRHT